jgi:hypothetical protein
MNKLGHYSIQYTNQLSENILFKKFSLNKNYERCMFYVYIYFYLTNNFKGEKYLLKSKAQVIFFASTSNNRKNE